VKDPSSEWWLAGTDAEVDGDGDLVA